MLCVWCLWSSSCLEGYHSFYAQLLRLGLSLGNFKVNDFLKGNVEYDKTYIKSAGSNIGQCSLWDAEEVTDLQKGWAWKKIHSELCTLVNVVPRLQRLCKQHSEENIIIYKLLQRSIFCNPVADNKCLFLSPFSETFHWNFRSPCYKLAFTLHSSLGFPCLNRGQTGLLRKTK